MVTNPTVSVIMSVHNSADLLDEAIKSVLHQTFSDFEFIIINDGSTDGSKKLLMQWAACDHRIRLIHQEHRGQAYSLNRALHLARGDYIARMDTDEISLPHRFEKQVSYLENHESIGVLGTNAELIDENGNHLFYTSLPTDPTFTAWSIHFTCPLHNSTVMMRKHLIEEAGGYGPSSIMLEDHDLWTRMTDIADVTNLADVCLKYR